MKISQILIKSTTCK